MKRPKNLTYEQWKKLPIRQAAEWAAARAGLDYDRQKKIESILKAEQKKKPTTDGRV